MNNENRSTTTNICFNKNDKTIIKDTINIFKNNDNGNNSDNNK